MVLGSVKRTGYPFHLPVSPSPPLLCITVCHHISPGHYHEGHVTSCKLYTWEEPLHAVIKKFQQKYKKKEVENTHRHTHLVLYTGRKMSYVPK